MTTLLAAALAAAGAAQAPGPPTFTARVETVYVDAFVTRGGQAVLGLESADFELKDDGAVRPFELVTADSVPLLAVLAFDQSGSVAGAKLTALQAAGAAFLDGLRASDEAGLLTFSEELAWAAPPTRDRARLRTALAGLRPRGGTAALDGLFAAITLPASPARTLVVLFSDGEDNLSWLGEDEVKRVAERANALVHVVGLGPPEPERPLGDASRDVLRAAEPSGNRALRMIAEATGGRFWPADSPERLQHTFAAIAEAMGHRYILRYEPPAGTRPGWHRLEVRLKSKPGDVRARRGYWIGG